MARTLKDAQDEIYKTHYLCKCERCNGDAVVEVGDFDNFYGIPEHGNDERAWKCPVCGHVTIIKNDELWKHYCNYYGEEMEIGRNMNNKSFNLLTELNAVRALLECDGAEMSVNYTNSEKCKKLQNEVDLLSAKEVEILNELRREILYKEEVKSDEKPKIAKKEVVIRSRSNGRKKG